MADVWLANVSQSYYCSTHFPFMWKKKYIEIQHSDSNTPPCERNVSPAGCISMWLCVVGDGEAVETRPYNNIQKTKWNRTLLDFEMQSLKASWSFHTALHIHNNTITCALFSVFASQITVWQIVTKIKTTQQQNCFTTTVNPKAPAHTDCETKALHVYKVRDCFWFWYLSISVH